MQDLIRELNILTDVFILESWSSLFHVFTQSKYWILPADVAHIFFLSVFWVNNHVSILFSSFIKQEALCAVPSEIQSEIIDLVNKTLLTYLGFRKIHPSQIFVMCVFFFQVYNISVTTQKVYHMTMTIYRAANFSRSIRVPLVKVSMPKKE